MYDVVLNDFIILCVHQFQNKGLPEIIFVSLPGEKKSSTEFYTILLEKFLGDSGLLRQFRILRKRCDTFEINWDGYILEIDFKYVWLMV